MPQEEPLPKTLKEALRSGYLRYEELSEGLKQAVNSHDAVLAGRFGAKLDVCRDGNSGPCSTTNYPDGTRKVCYCNAANQCDDCVFETPGG